MSRESWAAIWTYRLEKAALENLVRGELDAAGAQEVKAYVVAGACERGARGLCGTYVGISGNMDWIWSTCAGRERVSGQGGKTDHFLGDMFGSEAEGDCRGPGGGGGRAWRGVSGEGRTVNEPTRCGPTDDEDDDCKRDEGIHNFAHGKKRGKMKLALLICDDVSQPVKDIHGDYGRIFRHLLDRSNYARTTFTLDSYDVQVLEYPPDDSHYDGLLISGSRRSLPSIQIASHLSQVRLPIKT